MCQFPSGIYHVHRYSLDLISNDSERFPAPRSDSGNRRESTQRHTFTQFPAIPEFNVLTNHVDNFRTNIISAPIESPERQLSIGAKIMFVRKRLLIYHDSCRFPAPWFQALGIGSLESFGIRSVEYLCSSPEEHLTTWPNGRATSGTCAHLDTFPNIIIS